MIVYHACVAYVFEQFDNLPERERSRIRFQRIDTLITADIAEAEAFQPAHDCEACLAGTERTRQFLRDHPGSHIALANIHYTTEI